MQRDSMQTVARLRARREEQARGDLAAATAALAQAKQTHDAARAALRTPRSLAGDIDALRRERSVHLALRDSLDRATGQLALATREHAAATARWRQRRADQRAVERLLERRTDEARAAAAVAEQAALDELAIVLRDREVAS